MFRYEFYFLTLFTFLCFSDDHNIRNPFSINKQKNDIFKVLGIVDVSNEKSFLINVNGDTFSIKLNDEFGRKWKLIEVNRSYLKILDLEKNNFKIINL